MATTVIRSSPPGRLNLYLQFKLPWQPSRCSDRDATRVKLSAFSSRRDSYSNSLSILDVVVDWWLSWRPLRRGPVSRDAASRTCAARRSVVADNVGRRMTRCSQRATGCDSAYSSTCTYSTSCTTCLYSVESVQESGLRNDAHP